jgi:hypothetical protein
MTIPVYTVGALALLLQAWLSDKMQKRALFLIIAATPVTIAYLICVGTGNHGAGCAAMFILSAGTFNGIFISLTCPNTIIGVYSFSALCVTWVATNLVPDHKRSVGLPFFYSIGNLSGLVSSQLYPATDGPRYVKGNAISAGLEVLAVLFVVAAWFVLRKRNAAKDKMIADGATTNGKEGDEALDFKYTL